MRRVKKEILHYSSRTLFTFLAAKNAARISEHILTTISSNKETSELATEGLMC